MSFVKKAGKKLFKGIKKVAKKVWKPALIIGATLLTAGMAAPGFAGLSFSSGLSGFLGSVGSTIASGAATLAGTLGIGSAPGLFSPGAFGGLIGGGAGAAGTGFSTYAGGTPLVGVGSAGFAGGATAGATAATLQAGVNAATGGGFLSSVGKILGLGAGKGGGGLFSGPMGKMMLFNGIQGGVQSYMASKEADRQRKREDQGFFFGGPRRGGPAEIPGGSPFANIFGEEQAAEQQRAVAEGRTGQDQTQPVQVAQQSPSLMPQIMQPGNLDLIGPDPNPDRNLFGVV